MERIINLVVFLALACLALAANITVDDTDPGITYFPANSSGWHMGQNCEKCLAKPPEVDRIYNRTWHDATRDAGASNYFFEYKFQGTDLFVYGIILDVVDKTRIFITNTSLGLTIDGLPVATYNHEPRDYHSYSYQIPVFALRGLSNSPHTMRVNLTPGTMFLFDYLVYTYVDPLGPNPSSPTQESGVGATESNTSSSNGLPTGAIIALIVIGVLLAHAIALGLIILYIRNKRRRDRTSQGDLILGSKEKISIQLRSFDIEEPRYNQPQISSAPLPLRYREREKEEHRAARASAIPEWLRQVQGQGESGLDNTRNYEESDYTSTHTGDWSPYDGIMDEKY